VDNRLLLEATCKAEGIPTEVFMPDDDGQIPLPRLREAKAVCARCPVSKECLEYALKLNITVGIYGGLSYKGRREFVSGRKIITVNSVKQKAANEFKHGTLNGYERHKCRCIPCAAQGRKKWQAANEKRRAKKAAEAAKAV
jgi:WhiB family redox-sensing transcriptional regulator